MKVRFLTILMLAFAVMAAACGKSDADLATAVNDKLKADGVTGVTATVKDGVATLTGEVADVTVRTKAETAAKGVEGIKSVTNNVTTKPLPVATPAANDQALTGKIDENTTFDSTDFRNTVPRFAPEARKSNRALVNALETIAQRKKATPAQIALAWVLAQKPWIVPIPGTTKLHRLQENVAAASVALTEVDLREIESATSQITVQGARYSEAAQRMINR